MKMRYPANYTITLYDALEFDNTLLDILTRDEIFVNNKLKERFISYYGIYEIGGETLEMFRVFINRKYEELSNKYMQKLELWQNKLDYLKPVEKNISKDLTYTDKGSLIKNFDNTISYSGEDINVNYELPNRNTTNEYPSNKQKTIYDSNKGKTGVDTDNKDFIKTNKGNIIETKGYNIIEQTEKYNNIIKDIVQDFIYQFDTCFIQLM